MSLIKNKSFHTLPTCLVLSNNYAATGLRGKHLSLTLSASLILRRSCISQSSTTFRTLLCICSSVSPSFFTTLKRCACIRRARRATNSTCENFTPGQFCAPSDQGKKVSLGGVINSSVPSSMVFIQREGLHLSGFGQYLGCVWAAITQGLVLVFAGITILRFARIIS